MSNPIESKKQRLAQWITERDSLLVAFSGGVDSTFLLAMAHEGLGNRVVAATAGSPIHPEWETRDAVAFTRERQIHHIVFPSDELQDQKFVSNDPERCYHCKKRLVQRLFKIAAEKGIHDVAHGANMDDLTDYRPGFRATEEEGVAAPLVEAQLNKKEIRALSKAMGLSTWNKTAMACLATRIPYGIAITEKRLKMVSDSERFLRDMGIEDCRVRHHGSVARIEVGQSDFERVMSGKLKSGIVEHLRGLGFEHVALDLEGYIEGKMNRSVIRDP